MRVVIYARYSSDQQREASIEDQLRICKERIAREGWELVQVFQDRARSGASSLRAGYQALLAGAREGGVDLVLAEALDRLSRDQEGHRGPLQAAELRRLQGHDPGRGRDQQTACRPQGHDVPQAYRRQLERLGDALVNGTLAAAAVAQLRRFEIEVLGDVAAMIRLGRRWPGMGRSNARRRRDPVWIRRRI